MAQINITLDASHLTPAKAYAIAKKYGHPIPELEDAIASNRVTADKYARNILGGRFLKGEAMILTDAYLAYWYAEHIVKERWLEAEDVIKRGSNSLWWDWYCEHFDIK